MKPEDKNTLLTCAIEIIRMQIPHSFSGQWGESWVGIYGSLPDRQDEKIKKLKDALDIDNFDPILIFIRKIEYHFFSEEKKKNFEEHLKIMKIKNPEGAANFSLQRKNILSRVKELTSLQKEILLKPALEFSKVKSLSKAEDPTKLHPAQAFFIDKSLDGIFKEIMNYAGFFKLKLPPTTKNNKLDPTVQKIQNH